MSAPFVKIFSGDVLDHLRQLPDESVHCCVTSPPYWGLRDYSRCGCAIKREIVSDYHTRQPTSTDTGGGILVNVNKNPDPTCPICHGTGKIAGTERQLGLEPTPELYVQKMTEVFHEVKRVLRSDGTCWVNMGDCYSAGNDNHGKSLDDPDRRINDVPLNENELGWSVHRKVPGMKPKQLIGQPWRLAFALQADGWYLRSDIIWSKPNPMPESVTDRPTKAHEYIFLLSKSPRYFYDQEAVREKNADVSIKRAEYGWDCDRPSTKNANFGNPGIHVEKMGDRFVNPAGRNSRTVWDIATQPYPEAHFATFPEELPRRCIKAGTSEKGCCPKCGAPWERVVEGRTQLGAGYHNHEDDLGMGQHHLKGRKIIGQDYYNGVYSSGKTVGWQPTCSCNEPETVPCVVLDPFAGSGTTGAVARSMGRSSVLIELNPEYIKLIKERTNANVTALDGFSEEVNG